MRYFCKYFRYNRNGKMVTAFYVFQDEQFGGYCVSKRRSYVLNPLYFSKLVEVDRFARSHGYF